MATQVENLDTERECQLEIFIYDKNIYPGCLIYIPPNIENLGSRIYQVVSVNSSGLLIETKNVFDGTLKTFIVHKTPNSSVPVKFLKKADKRIDLLHSIDQLITTLKGECFLVEKKFKRTDALMLACQKVSACNQYYELISISKYYRYKKLFLKYHGDRVQIACSFHRSTFGRAKFDKNSVFVKALVMEGWERIITFMWPL